MKSHEDHLREQLKALKLPFIREQYPQLLRQAAQEQWAPLELLVRLIEGEANLRADHALRRRIKAAHFPVLKTLDTYDWSWPKKINRAQIQDLARLAWVPEHGNVIFLGGVGLGKTHLATALGYAACEAGHSVIFATAVEIINTLTAAQAQHRLKAELKKFLKPALLLLDEIGYLPIDKQGADLLFQVISQRYEHGALILTTNTPFKLWPTVFNNDSTLVSALLDRLLHHAETVVIEGKSYRMKDQRERDG
jgi:DNA replication protein DnaC